MKVGIFFGGPSREREISFAGGRTVYDNLNKSLFKPVPIFVDSNRNYILLDWEYVYKGTIRDFYPPVSFHPKTKDAFQIYIESLGDLTELEQDEIIAKVGRRILPHEFSKYFDFAFLALHGYFGEDGIIQGLLESHQIPYSGSGIRSCSIGMDKSIQKSLMEQAGFSSPKIELIKRENWTDDTIENWYRKAQTNIKFPLVIRPANQGSSIGVSILTEDKGLEAFETAVNEAFFIQKVKAIDWNNKSAKERIQFVQDATDIRSGIGFPLTINQGLTIFHPAELMFQMDQLSLHGEDIHLASHLTEQKVLLESFIKGREFSCIVVRKEDRTSLAFPPTEIVKFDDLYDYRSKYLPGLSRKVTPIDLEISQINSIRKECERLFEYLDFQTYARIDGFYGNDGHIYLNDPNTTSGMLPSSFFFHQAAEIGLNPSEFLTYIIRISIMERVDNSLMFNEWSKVLANLDNDIEKLKQEKSKRTKIGVILGGYSFERHISVESGRNIFEKLSSSDKYEPIPIFLRQAKEGHELVKIPISLLLKDNADDIRDKISAYATHEVTEEIKTSSEEIINKYVIGETIFAPELISYDELKTEVDAVFIALHGRPGEDGTVQRELHKRGIPYNGSDWDSTHVTINKYETLQLLKKNGFTVADQKLVSDEAYHADKNAVMDQLVDQFNLPFIIKPVDDGCSSAVMIIKDRMTLESYLDVIFREDQEIDSSHCAHLGISQNEEFPSKRMVLVESLIQSQGAFKFMEITGGLLTHIRNGEVVYEIFEPSEALAGGEVLSLEEKFLAGEGQNITPARFSLDPEEYLYIAAQVKGDLERAARLLKVKGYARIDAFVRIDKDLKAETIIIEVNSLPGMTPATCIFHQSALYNYKPYQFIDKILEFAFDEQKTTKG